MLASERPAAAIGLGIPGQLGLFDLANPSMTTGSTPVLATGTSARLSSNTEAPPTIAEILQAIAGLAAGDAPEIEARAESHVGPSVGASIADAALTALGLRPEDSSSFIEAILALVSARTFEDVPISDVSRGGHARADVAYVDQLVAALLSAAYLDTASIVSESGAAIAPTADSDLMNLLAAAMMGAFEQGEPSALSALLSTAVGSHLAELVGSMDGAETSVASSASDAAAITALIHLLLDKLDQTGVDGSARAEPAIGARSSTFLDATRTSSIVEGLSTDYALLEALAVASHRLLLLDALPIAERSWSGVSAGATSHLDASELWSYLPSFFARDVPRLLEAILARVAPSDVAYTSGVATLAATGGRAEAAPVWESLNQRITHAVVDPAHVNAAAGYVGVSTPIRQRASFFGVATNAVRESTRTRTSRGQSQIMTMSDSLTTRWIRNPTDHTRMRDAVRANTSRSVADSLTAYTAAGGEITSGYIEKHDLVEAVSFTFEEAEPPDTSSRAPSAIQASDLTATSSPTGAATEVPAPTIVPPAVVRSPAIRGEALSVVWPTRAATLRVPEHGVTLNVPAGARPTIFQARVAVESADSLEQPPDGEVLRVVRIEIFDALGRPVADPSPEKPLDLVIRLTPLDAARINGNGSPSNSSRRTTISLQRFEPEKADQSWLEIPVTDVRDGEVVASLDHLSLFALVLRSQASGPVAGDRATPGERSSAPGTRNLLATPDVTITSRAALRSDERRQMTIILAATGTSIGGLLVVQGGRWLVNRRSLRRKPRQQSPG